MFDDFCIASKKELRTRRGIVYLIVFSSGEWYCGSTGQTFRLRYGTTDLKKSYLLTNESVEFAVANLEYTICLYINDFINDEERLAKEFSIIGDHASRNHLCLNRCDAYGNYGKRRSFSLKSPSGKIVSFDSLRTAVPILGITNHSTLSDLLAGKIRSVAGWTLPGFDGPIGHDALCKKITLCSPLGDLVTFDSYKSAAEVIGSRISKLASGEDTTANGWTIPGSKKRKHLPVKLNSPDGTVHHFLNRVEASKAIGCCNQLVSMLCVGKAPHAKGWTLAEAPENREGR